MCLLTTLYSSRKGHISLFNNEEWGDVIAEFSMTHVGSSGARNRGITPNGDQNPRFDAGRILRGLTRACCFRGRGIQGDFYIRLRGKYFYRLRQRWWGLRTKDKRTSYGDSEYLMNLVYGSNMKP